MSLPRHTLVVTLVATARTKRHLPYLAVQEAEYKGHKEPLKS